MKKRKYSAFIEKAVKEMCNVINIPVNSKKIIFLFGSGVNFNLVDKNDTDNELFD